jgi:hypothetical protein
MTPKFRQEMVTHVSMELNRLYSLYIQKNPDFDGKISIYGHSLGSVIAFDIASLQRSCMFDHKSNPLKSLVSTAEIDISEILAKGSGSSKGSDPIIDPIINITSEKLVFEIDHLFTVGSPVGMFLLLGGSAIRPHVEGLEQESTVSVPLVKALYNVV